MHVFEIAEVVVHEILLRPGWDTVLFGAVCVGLLVIGIFRLDELFASNKSRAQARHTPQRPPRGMEPDGSHLMSDPDGRVWRVKPKRN